MEGYCDNHVVIVSILPSLLYHTLCCVASRVIHESKPLVNGLDTGVTPDTNDTPVSRDITRDDTPLTSPCVPSAPRNSPATSSSWFNSCPPANPSTDSPITTYVYFLLLDSPLTTLDSPLTTLYSPLTTFYSPLITEVLPTRPLTTLD